MNRDAYTLTNGSGGTTVSTAISVIQLKAGTNYALEILEFAISMRGSTTSATERISIVRKTAAATVTAAVAGTTLFKQNTVNATSDVVLSTTGTGITATGEGTDGDVLFEAGFNVLSGYEKVWIPESRIVVPVSGIIAAKFLTAPASNIFMLRLTYRELG